VQNTNKVNVPRKKKPMLLSDKLADLCIIALCVAKSEAKGSHDNGYIDNFDN
jgi:hypothetical protein